MYFIFQAMHELEMTNQVKAYFLADISIVDVCYYFETQGVCDIWRMERFKKCVLMHKRNIKKCVMRGGDKKINIPFFFGLKIFKTV